MTRWFALTTPLNKEKDLEKKVNALKNILDIQKDVVFYSPKVILKEAKKGQMIEHRESMFSGYCFIGIRTGISQTAFFEHIEGGFVQVLRESRGKGEGTYLTYAKIPQREIDCIRMQELCTIKPMKCEFKVGDSVEIKDGFFKGYIGEVAGMKKDYINVKIYFVFTNMVIETRICDVVKIENPFG